MFVGVAPRGESSNRLISKRRTRWMKRIFFLNFQVRVQCFHYLLPKSEGSSKKFDFMYEEPDPKVQELSKVLINVDEAMVCSLQPRKTKVSRGIFLLSLSND
mgnify:CR=1 FL=1